MLNGNASIILYLSQNIERKRYTAKPEGALARYFKSCVATKASRF
jgi:hypothetical protein